MRIPHRFKVSSDASSVVVSTRPRGGRRVRRGTIVTLRLGGSAITDGPGRLAHVRVPDFAGRPLSVATRWVNRRGLQWKAVRLPALKPGPSVRAQARTLLGNYRVTRQRPAPGKVLAYYRKCGSHCFHPTPLTLHGRLRANRRRCSPFARRSRARHCRGWTSYAPLHGHHRRDGRTPYAPLHWRHRRRGWTPYAPLQGRRRHHRWTPYAPLHRSEG